MQQPAEGGQGSSCKLGLHLMLSRSQSSPNLPCEPGLCRITLLITPSRLEKQFWSSVRCASMVSSACAAALQQQPCRQPMFQSAAEVHA
jgi:hypothetical protein